MAEQFGLPFYASLKRRLNFSHLLLNAGDQLSKSPYEIE
jgi:hypothetical protein